MKILWVKAGGLVPPDTGGKIRSYNIIRELARKHSITFFSFYAAHQPDAHPGLKDILDNVVCIPLNLPRAKSASELFSYCGRVFSSEPYGISKFCRPMARKRLRTLLAEESYDVIVCDFVFAAGVIPWDLPIPKVLFTHNVEAIIWRRHYEVAKNPVWKAISRREWRKMEAAEHNYLRRADRVLAVSENDRDAFANFIDRAKIDVIPTGVDVDYFQPKPIPEVPNSIIFTGSMDWLPNEDAIFYYANEILPLIKRRCPDVSLEVVGRSPSRKLQALADTEKSIRLTGWVDDIRPYLARGSVCIVPLRIGGGTRLKIFEAMAMGKAVVSTSVGAEGLSVRSGDHVLLADTPAEFAESVVALFGNQQERTRLGATARALVEENYSWARIAAEFARALDSVVVATQRTASQPDRNSGSQLASESF